MNCENVGKPVGYGNRRKIADGIVGHILYQRQSPRAITVKKKRIAITRRLDDELRRDNAAAPCPVLDDHLLAQNTRQTLRDDACDEIRTPANFGSDHANRLNRELLSRRNAGSPSKDAKQK